MKGRWIKGIGGLVMLLCILALIQTEIRAAAREIARMTEIRGNVRVGALRLIAKKPCYLNAPICSGDKVQVIRGEAKIEFADGSILRVFEKTAATLSESKKEEKFRIFQRRFHLRRIRIPGGKLWASIKPNAGLITEFCSATTRAEVIGSTIEVMVNPANGRMIIGCLKDTTRIMVTVDGKRHTVTLTANTRTVIIPGQPPTKPRGYKPSREVAAIEPPVTPPVLEEPGELPEPEASPFEP